MQKAQIFHNDSAKVFRLQIKYWENPVLLLDKSLRRSPSLHFHLNGKWPLPQAKILSNILSGTTLLSMYQRPALQQDCWMTPFHEWPQTIKHLKPCLHRRLDGAHYFFFCLPRFYHPTQSYRRMTHIWTLLLPIHPNTSPNSTSQEVSCFSWWVKMCSTDFMKLMITILFQIKISISSVYY